MEARAKEFCRKKKERHSKLKSNTLPWHDLWQRIAEYFVPRLGTISVQRHEADLLDERLFDDIGKEVVEDFGAGCVNYMCPAGEQWARLEPDYLNPSEEAQSWFVKTSTRILEMMTASGFYLEIHDDLITSAAFGTSNLKVEKGKSSPYKFDEIQVGKYCFEADADGFPNIVYFEFEYTAEQMIDRWGKENMHNDVLDAYEKEQVTSKFRILEVIYPREGDNIVKGYAPADQRPFGVCWIDSTHDHLISEDGFYENPYIISRMYKTADSHWGYSLAMRTLPKVQQLNQMEEDKMLAEELKLDPPWLKPDEGSFESTNVPGGINFYKATLDPRHRPEQLDLKNDVHTATEAIQMKRDEVRRSFFIDMFQVFANHPRQKTATEVLAIIEEKLVLFTPFFARYTREKLDRIFERCFNIALREGYIDEPPMDVLQNGGSYKITYTSRIANTLRLMENKNLMTAVDFAMPMAELDPTIRMVGKWREMYRRFLTNMAVDPDLQFDESEIQGMLKQQQALEQAAQGVAVAEQAAKAVGHLPDDQQQALLAG